MTIIVKYYGMDLRMCCGILKKVGDKCYKTRSCLDLKKQKERKEEKKKKMEVTTSSSQPKMKS